MSLTVTLLSPLEPMNFDGEADLLSQLRPQRDGLLIEDAGRQALFLPAVWEQLTQKEEFLAHLKAKAGLSRGHWSPTFRAKPLFDDALRRRTLALWASEREVA